MTTEDKRPKMSVRRIGGRLHRIVPILDAADRIIQYAVSPLRVELQRRDIMQILIGSAVLAIPVGFTEETWELGGSLPLHNVLLLAAMSLLFIAAYVYFNFYRTFFHQHIGEYVKRVLAIYLLSLLVVGSLLTIIQRAPWQTDPLTAIKRTILVAFPASMSAAVSDSID